MKKIKGLIIALLGALMLGIAAIPASAQGWNHNRTISPSNRHDDYVNRRDQYNRNRNSRSGDGRDQDNRGWDNRGRNNFGRDAARDTRFQSDGGRYQSYTFRSDWDNQRNRNYRRH